MAQPQLSATDLATALRRIILDFLRQHPDFPASDAVVAIRILEADLRRITGTQVWSSEAEAEAEESPVADPAGVQA